jgi:aldehyde oxidoreductase
MDHELDVALFVNGEPVRARVPPDLSLMRFLRDWLGLTGTKNGCDAGHCGACTVVLDGRAVRSCLVKMAKVDGAQVQTVEGLAQEGDLHPLQYAFVKHGASQCGYCTPGMLMTAKALLDQNPDPSADEIKAALTRGRNLCRCTGYVNIIGAIQAAARMLQRGERPETNAWGGGSGDGAILPEDALDHVTGKTEFAGDIAVDGMLHGKVLWAAHPHARILDVDTSEAERMYGVEIVITAEDIPGINQAGLLVRDQPAIADDKVRFIGDPVAVVFADEPRIAEQALDRIRVEYEILPGVFSPQEAARPNAARIHSKGNLACELEITRGDVDEAFERCAVVVEDQYTTPWIEHGFLEPESGIAFPTPDGGVVLKIGTQAAFSDRSQLSEILGLPEEKVRVVQLPVGGAFGGKEDLVLHQHLALGALLTGRPVKMVLSRPESMRVHVKKHPAWMHYKLGADREGHLLALKADIVIDTGAYMSNGHKVLMNMVEFAAGPYYIPNLHVQGKAWHTNNVIGGAMRGFGANQVAFAVEQQIDGIARQLDIDPFEIRRVNALDAGLPTAADQILPEGLITVKQTLDAAEEALAAKPIPTARSGRRIGIGVASGVKPVGFGRQACESAEAVIELDSSGRLVLKHSQHTLGQGTKGALLRLVTGEFAFPPEQIEIVGPDTAVTPPTGATTASRQTFLTGNATLKACHALKEHLLARAAELLDQDPKELVLHGDRVLEPRSGRAVELASLGESFVERERYTARPTTPFPEGESRYGAEDFESRFSHWCYTCCTQVAVVEVDMETGAAKVLKVISANDLGKVINRQAVEGQIYGGVVQGLGYALSEEFVIQNGFNQTCSLRSIGIPAADSTPEIVPVLLEVPHPDGPWGAKGFAEAPILPTAPAITNAICDAVGVRVTDLPATPERVLSGLRRLEA